MATLAFIVADGVIYASWLFIVAVGMTLVYGVMRILNVAHGSLYALGAYTAATMVGAWFQRGYAPLGSFVLLLVAALVVGLVMGLILELGLLRFLHGRDEVVVVLATYATFLILEDVIQLIWGVEARPAPQPYSLLGTTTVGPLLLNNYDLALIALALLVGGVGLSRAAAVHLLPQAEVFAIYLIMTLVLIIRPYGLLGHERLRKV